ncbi:proton-coupled folate transporter-like [Acanthaster planci]|uniref:Proton-coupled folate transporter-like n=1 Tax=Acanthaster planci TaxID=133434 RepID=A0A8B7ZY40_ACAPL|nr:proton-coupled folate transporter-like [Acanthaster planci]XP_022110325.1 proton-coupled folate transporter-like [Acanthaster planci]XP_022110334.1 proton-coupled folate transporter-like [Acanthaster planci]XP_022110342.1 proton-coupled folate transporter-like [Acanthaster planci]XP_022110351.1 proton-coupled folate transporter-like [Acanthaster planci]XP_022110360.1 proton-coupled folate transporter-like [Acanthaster planci]
MHGPDFGGEVRDRHYGQLEDVPQAPDQVASRSQNDDFDVTVSESSCPAKIKNFCFKNMDWLRRVSVEPALLFVMVSMGLTNGVSIQYVQERIYENFNITSASGGACSNQTSEPTDAEKAAAAELNGFNVISGFAGGFPALFVTLIISAASDRVGRKLPLVLPVAGMLCGTVVFLLIALLDLPVVILLISNVALSFTGGYPLFFSGCSSYVADTTAKKDRTFLFALLFTLSLVGSGIASISAGYWIKGGSFADPFWLSFALLSSILLYLIFWVPETVRADSKSSEDDSLLAEPRSSKLSAVWKGLSGILGVAGKGRRVWLLLALTVLFVSMGVFGAINSILFIRLLSMPFCWSSVLIGYFNASKPFINGLGLTLGARYLTKCLKDYAVIQLGLLSTVGMLVIICISTDTYGMFLVNVVGCLHALPPAILMAKMSKVIEPKLQGALFSLTGTTESLANLLGPFLLGLIYQGTLNTFPLAVFIVMIGLTVSTMAIVGVLMIMECGAELGYHQLHDDGETEDEEGEHMGASQGEANGDIK